MQQKYCVSNPWWNLLVGFKVTLAGECGQYWSNRNLFVNKCNYKQQNKDKLVQAIILCKTRLTIEFLSYSLWDHMMTMLISWHKTWQYSCMTSIAVDPLWMEVDGWCNTQRGRVLTISISLACQPMFKIGEGYNFHVWRWVLRSIQGFLSCLSTNHQRVEGERRRKLKHRKRKRPLENKGDLRWTTTYQQTRVTNWQYWQQNNDMAMKNQYDW